jgi:hypothetical protein
MNLIENAHAVYVVKKGRERAVRDILTNMGFDPRTQQIPGTLTEQRITMPAEEEQTLTPVLDFYAELPQTGADVRIGKYSSEMKKLETNEVYHVIEYAILMGLRVKIDYDGTPGCRKGTYTVIPSLVRRGKDACMVAEVASSKKKREWDVRMIRRIGVETDDEDR